MAENMRVLILFFYLICATGLFGQFWIQKASFGGVGRHRATGCANSHRGFMGLGHVNGTGQDISYKDWWEYDPSSDTWTQRADFPVSTHGAVSFVVDNCPVVGGGSALSTQFYKFDPSLNTWTPIANCILPNPGDSQAFAVNNRGFVYQGNQLAKYNPNTNSWSVCATAPMTFGNWTCSFVVEGSAYIKGGLQLWEYKPLHDQWLQRASFPGQSTGGSSGFAIEQHGYVTSGYVGGLSVVTDQVWSFHPATNTWQQEIEFDGAKRRFPVAFAIHDRGYIGTGTNGINFNDFWQFNPTDNTIGIEESSAAIMVYPNPVSDFITVLGDPTLTVDQDITIYSLDGKLHLKEPRLLFKQNVDLSHLQTGTYLLRIEQEGHILYQEKIMKR
ncbi:MAG: T9SS type A sorting domain-containing protein [Sphingomonadales bacterium]|nr:T9SS type A sorting domain-containing protein [Sphingomonadales bacterium]